MMYCKLLAVTLLLAASCQARPRWGDARPTWGPMSGAHGSTWEMTVLEEVGPSVGQVYGIYHGNPWADVDDDQVGSPSNQWSSQHGSVVNSPRGSSGHAAGNRYYHGGSTWGVSSGQHGQPDVASAWAGQGNQDGNGWASGNSWKQARRSSAWSGNGNGHGSNPWGGANQQTRSGRTNSWSNSDDVDQPWTSTSSRMSNHGSASSWGASSRANQAGRNNGWKGMGNSWAGSDEEDQSEMAGNHGVNQAGSRSWGQGNAHQGGSQGSQSNQGNQGHQGGNWSWGQGQNNQGVSQAGSRSWGQGQASQGAHQGGQQGGNQNGNQGTQGNRGHQGGNQANQGSRWSWGQGQNNQVGNQDMSHGANQMGNQDQGGSHSSPSGVSKGWGMGNQNGAAVMNGQVHKGGNPVVVLPSAGHGRVSPVAGASHHGQVPHQHGEDQDDSDEQETGGQHGHHHHHDDDQESPSVRQQYGRRQY